MWAGAWFAVERAEGFLRDDVIEFRHCGILDGVEDVKGVGRKRFLAEDTGDVLGVAGGFACLGEEVVEVRED